MENKRRKEKEEKKKMEWLGERLAAGKAPTRGGTSP